MVGEAVKVMEAVGEKFGHTFTFEDMLMGGCAIDAVGKVLPRRHRREVQKPATRCCWARWAAPSGGHSSDPEKRPETALLSIRKDLGL